MKKIWLSIFLLGPLFATAQSINGIPLPNLDANYIEICESKGLENGIIEISFNISDPQIDAAEEIVITDRNDVEMQFSSGMHAVNFWSRYYNLEFAYAFFNSLKEVNEYRYVLKRKTR